MNITAAYEAHRSMFDDLGGTDHDPGIQMMMLLLL
jgi:hypothetical protein